MPVDLEKDQQLAFCKGNSTWVCMWWGRQNLCQKILTWNVFSGNKTHGVNIVLFLTSGCANVSCKDIWACWDQVAQNGPNTLYAVESTVYIPRLNQNRSILENMEMRRIPLLTRSERVEECFMAIWDALCLIVELLFSVVWNQYRNPNQSVTFVKIFIRMNVRIYCHSHGDKRGRR